MSVIEQIKYCIEHGKVNLAAPYPPEMKGKPGADELTAEALKEGLSPARLLNEALLPAMENVGQLFAEQKIFVPQMLISAKAMDQAMNHLKPYFQSGEIQKRGIMIIGTVAGDLHDIGKNLVSMMVEGSGWDVVDLGVDVKTEKFVEILDQHPDAVIGLSALLTTTMVHMEKTVEVLKAKSPETRILIGGAPLSQSFCDQIHADFCGKDPQMAVEYLSAN